MAKKENNNLKSMDIVAYPESCNIVEAFEKITKNYVVEKYAYILHDKDTNEDGEVKKEHYHIYLVFSQPVNIGTISKIFNTAPNNINSVKNYQGLLRYYRHMDNPEKHQYRKDELHLRNIDPAEFENRTDAKNTEESALKVLIEKMTEENASLKSIMMYALENGMYFAYRSNYAILRDIYRENKDRENVKEFEQIKNEVKTLLGSKGQRGDFEQPKNQPSINDLPF